MWPGFFENCKSANSFISGWERTEIAKIHLNTKWDSLCSPIYLTSLLHTYIHHPFWWPPPQSSIDSISHEFLCRTVAAAYVGNHQYELLATQGEEAIIVAARATVSMIFSKWKKKGFREELVVKEFKKNLLLLLLFTWWFGYTSVSATTTFSLLPAANTTISAISSGVKGSQPLPKEDKVN